MTVKPQTAQIIDRIFRHDQCLFWAVEPVIKAGRQKPHGRTGGQYGQASISSADIGRTDWYPAKSARFGNVEIDIGLKTPGIEHNGEVISQHIVTGEIKINQPAHITFFKKHIIGEQVGMNHPFGQTCGQPLRDAPILGS